MPYIEQTRREKFYDLIAQLADKINYLEPGELNFVLTKLCLHYVGERPTYRNFNEVLGVLEAVKFEFYMRAVSPYEEEKKEQNGDVY